MLKFRLRSLKTSAEIGMQLIIAVCVRTIFLGLSGMTICSADYNGFPHFEESPTIPTPEKSGQTVHPSILYFSKAWNGYNFWMANTPYPFRQNSYEKPIIIVGDSGMTTSTAVWSVPIGLTNPINSVPPGAYYADTDLVYNDQTDQLWCYYIENAGAGISNLILQKSDDGVNWSDNLVIKKWNTKQRDNCRSPAVVKRGKNKWMMWEQTKHVGSRVVYSSSTDGIHWSSETAIAWTSTPPEPVWHLDVNYISEHDEYWMLYCGYESNIYFAKADASDPLAWDVYSMAVMERRFGYKGGFDWSLYRPTFLYNINGDDKIHLWYGVYGQHDNQKWKAVSAAKTGYSVTTYTELAEFLGIDITITE